MKDFRKDRSNIQKRQLVFEQKLNLQPGSVFWNKIYQFNMTIKFNNNYRFFHLQIAKYNLFTKKHAAHFRENNNLCCLCNNEPEEMSHLLFNCNIVQDLIREIRNCLTVMYPYDPVYLNNPEKFLLGIGFKHADNLTFLLTINIARYVWISKHKNNIPSLAGFKNFFNYFIKTQKYVGILDSLQNINIEQIWN